MEPILYETVDFEKIERRKRRKRYWIISIVGLVSIVLLAYAILLLPLLFKDNNSAINTWQDKNIPLYTNEIFQTRTNYTLQDSKTKKPNFYFEKRVYMSSDREQQVKEFFNKQLTANGWIINKAEPPGGLDPLNGQTNVRVILKRGTTQTLTLELSIYAQRTVISLSYQEALT